MTLNQPSPEMVAMIQECYNEDPKTRDSDVKYIKNWLKKQPHLPNTWDDQRILTFLRASKFSLEVCKAKLDSHFTVKNAAPEFYSNRDVNSPEVQEVFKLVQVSPLPELTSEGWRVCIMRGTSKTAPSPNMQATIKTIFMLADIRLAEELCAGDVYVIDGAVEPYSFLSKFTPSVVKKYTACLEMAYSIKLKGVHLINANPVVETIITLFKPFLKEKIKKRIFVHKNMESLYKHVPREILPEEYGGNAGPTMDIHNAWIKKIISYGDWFKADEKMKADESRRPGKPKNQEDLFGVSGSFRKMIID